MNINLIKLKGIIQELRLIRHEISRLADCWEAELSLKGYNMRPPKADTSGPPPELMYTDEELDWMNEEMAKYEKYKGKPEVEE